MRNFRNWAAAGIVLATTMLTACGGGGSSDSASVRLVNATVTHSSLSLLANAGTAASGVAVDTVSSYAGVDSGSPVLQVNDAATATVLATTAPSLAGGQHYTVLAFENNGTVRTTLIGEDAAAPSAGTASLRVFDAATDAGALDVYVVDPNADPASVTSPTFSLAAASTVQASSFLSFPPGTYRVLVTGSGNRADLRLDIPAVVLASQQLATVVLTPASGGTLVNGSVVLQQGAYSAARNTSVRLRLAAAVTNGAPVAVSAGATPIAAMTSPSVGAYATVPAGAALSISVGGVAVAAPTTSLAAGSDATLLVYGDAAAPAASLIVDDNHLPASNTTLKLRLLNGLTGAATPVTLIANFAVVASNVAPAQASAYAVVGAATPLTLDVTTPASPTPVNVGTNLAVPGNSVYTLFMLGSASAPVPLLRRDR